MKHIFGILILLKLTFCDLIIESFEQLTTELLEKEGKLLESITVHPDPICEDIIEVRNIYEITLKQDGVASKQNITLMEVIENDVKVEAKNSDGEESDFLVFRKYLNCYNQEHPKLIEALKTHYIEPPSTETLASFPELELVQSDQGLGQYQQDKILDKLLFQGKVKNGFFIEAGAWDFAELSNTLWYEVKYNWTGLLIEPTIKPYINGRDLNRKAWSTCSCLSIFPKPR